MIEIPPHETGTTRVFALSMSNDAARALREDPERQKALLGAETLDAKGIEVFPVSDLGEMGLAGYLREGAGANEADLKRDSAKLAAVDGWAMLVHSSAASGKGATLSPAPALTLIGTYAETRDQTPPVDLQAEAAQPYTGVPGTPPPLPQGKANRGSLVVAVIALIVLIAIWLLLT